MSRRTAAAATTRQSLIREARARFGSQGFAATCADDLVAALGLTRGALYGHFPRKEDLFRAVFDDVETELVARVLAAGQRCTSDPWDGVQATVHAYLETCVDPVVSRVLFLDGPVVLGWEMSHDNDEGFAPRQIVAHLHRMLDEGFVDADSVEPLADMIVGAVTRLGIAVARSPHPREARADAVRLLSLVSKGLAATQGDINR